MTAKSSHKCLWSLAVACALAPALAGAQVANPLGRYNFDPVASLDGTWNGADLEARSNCSASQNDGNRGTYGQYVIGADTVTHSIGITENGITGLNCSYGGDYQDTPSGPQWSGTYACSDGKHGTFQSKGFLVTPHEMSIRLSIKLDTTETCDIDAILGGSRF